MASPFSFANLLPAGYNAPKPGIPQGPWGLPVAAPPSEQFYKDFYSGQEVSSGDPRFAQINPTQFGGVPADKAWDDAMRDNNARRDFGVPQHWRRITPSRWKFVNNDESGVINAGEFSYADPATLEGKEGKGGLSGFLRTILPYAPFALAGGALAAGAVGAGAGAAAHGSAGANLLGSGLGYAAPGAAASGAAAATAGATAFPYTDWSQGIVGRPIDASGNLLADFGGGGLGLQPGSGGLGSGAAGPTGTIRDLMSSVASKVNPFGGGDGMSFFGLDFGDLLNVGSRVFSGIKSSEAAKDAAKAQVQSGDAAISEQRRQFDTNRADLMPWRAAGLGTLSSLMSGMGPDGEFIRPFSMADYEQDPGYQFRLSEGEKAIDRMAGAQGGRDSGATMKALMRFNQDHASNEYANAYNRFQTDQGNQFNRLAAISGVGQTATNQVANMGSQNAQNIGNILMGQGTARGNAAIARGNAWTGTVGSLADFFQQQQARERARADANSIYGMY